MIKLNNKNITYVALADSNNSVKGVKEIWYADSTNSVKLVYRRKDALIDGEDYEKYHWLKTELTYGTMMQLPIDSLSFTFERIIQSIDAGNTYYFKIGQEHYYTDGDKILRIWNNGTTTYVLNEDVTFGEPITIESSSAYLTFNSVSVPQPSSSIEYIEFGASRLADNINIKTSSVTEGGTKRYIPCKLLKPVPKWLDANGIRRQVGECGMIDLVSGKFYGNVNNVGTFTVENYYERKEWLVGDGSAYIDTGHNVNEDLDYETKAYLLPNTYLFWYRTNTGTGDNTMVVMSNTKIHIGQRVANNSYDIKITDTDDAVEIKWEGEYVDINDTKYHVTKHIELNHNFNLFYIRLEARTDSSGYTSNNVKCAYFRFLDSNRNYVQNLIPCTLTMDLPASMDANNIARTKGTSGMWDLVSDRFYGNVANSGTFKAVNLAEGVDYEVHQWLQGRNGAYIDTNYYSTTYIDSFKGKCRYDGTLRNPDGREQDVFGVNDSDNNTLGAYIATTNKFAAFYHKTINDIWLHCSTGNEHEFSIYANGDTFYCIDNGILYQRTTNGLPEKTFDYSIYLFARNPSPTLYFHGDIAYFKITDTSSNIKMNLIPVKLLRSIPAKYDANGIARQAGECGMYDTVNDVFYGNVASSGSFTVEDDS